MHRHFHEPGPGPVSAGAGFSPYQQGTYAPDNSFRWMGSAAMDKAGDIALGYSVSSSTGYPTVYPSVRYRPDSDRPARNYGERGEPLGRSGFPDRILAVGRLH